MKALFYSILCLLVLNLVACRSIEKMTEKGQYEEAFRYAAKKLQGSKDKKLKYVRGFEEAYAKLNAADNQKIAYLQATNQGNIWDQVYTHYVNLENRQKVAEALSPLVASNGYVASLPTKNYNSAKIEAINHAAAYHYDKGQTLFNQAKARNVKSLAQEAYHEFIAVDGYLKDYKDTNQLREKARAFGTFNVGIAGAYTNNRMAEEVLFSQVFNRNLRDMSTTWVKYFRVNNSNEMYDRIITIKVNDVQFGYEREKVDNHTFTKEIEDGIEYLVDRSGHFVKDSLGNKIVVPKKVTVEAVVSEIFREKGSAMEIGITMKNDRNAKLDYKTMQVVHEFKDKAAMYRGDRRALPSQFSQSTANNTITPFPNDAQVMAILADNAVNDIYYAICQMRIED